MPKVKHRETKTSTPVSRRVAFKLGNRKSVTSALQVSTKDLLNLYFKPKLKKDRPKIAKVLANRGVPLIQPEDPAVE